MKVVISPAKSLNWDVNYPEIQFSKPLFLEDASKVNNKLRKYSPKKLKSLQSISENLASLNYQRNHAWNTDLDDTLSKPAVFAFDGEVYQGLKIEEFSKEELVHSQENLRILSGLYGMLKPLDLIMPYRLEMGTSLKVWRSKNLYDFWNKKVTEKLKSEMAEGECLVNLASSEYFKVIDTKSLDRSVIQIKFLDKGSSGYKVMSFYAKKARGLMASYILRNRVEKKDELKKFNEEGYYFDQTRSEENILVFLNDR